MVKVQQHESTLQRTNDKVKLLIKPLQPSFGRFTTFRHSVECWGKILNNLSCHKLNECHIYALSCCGFEIFWWKCSESVAIYESFSTSTSAAVTKSRRDWFLIIFMSVSRNSHTRSLELVCHDSVENSAFINKSCERLKISEKIHNFYERDDVKVAAETAKILPSHR